MRNSEKFYKGFGLTPGQRFKIIGKPEVKDMIFIATDDIPTWLFELMVAHEIEPGWVPSEGKSFFYFGLEGFLKDSTVWTYQENHIPYNTTVFKNADDCMAWAFFQGQRIGTIVSGSLVTKESPVWSMLESSGNASDDTLVYLSGVATPERANGVLDQFCLKDRYLVQAMPASLLIKDVNSKHGAPTPMPWSRDYIGIKEPNIQFACTEGESHE